MKYIPLLIMTLLLTACNNEKKPLTFSEGENFMDVNTEFYSVNGARTGRTYDDLIESDKDSVKAIIDVFK